MLIQITENSPKVAHPAKFTEQLFPVMARMLQGTQFILDPFAGVGGVFTLRFWLPNTHIEAVELEPEWADAHPRTKQGSALALPYLPNTFDAIVTSPAYGNRMADKIISPDKSRNTYADYLRRPLSNNSGAALQWGKDYQEFHRDAWLEASRVLTDDGIIVLNIKDHLRTVPLSKLDNDGYMSFNKHQASGNVQVRVHVTQWHSDTLRGMGFMVDSHEKVYCPGNRQGENGNDRIAYESVIKFVRDGR